MRKYRNATRVTAHPALVWNPVATAFRGNRAARRSKDAWYWRQQAVAATWQVHRTANAVAALLVGVEQDVPAE